MKEASNTQGGVWVGGEKDSEGCVGDGGERDSQEVCGRWRRERLTGGGWVREERETQGGVWRGSMGGG